MRDGIARAPQHRGILPKDLLVGAIGGHDAVLGIKQDDVRWGKVSSQVASKSRASRGGRVAGAAAGAATKLPKSAKMAVISLPFKSTIRWQTGSQNFINAVLLAFKAKGKTVDY